MKKIVTIGGGSGHFSLLKSLKKYPYEITAIVTMMDSGGSTGTLSEAYGVLPLGDIRRCLAALAKDAANVEKIFNYRFPNGPLTGHTCGNILLTACVLEFGDLHKVIELISSWLNLDGRILPVTLDRASIVAELEDNSRVIGEKNIDIPKHNANLHITSLTLEPKPKTTIAVQKALKVADLIVLSMGDLYTSVLPNLLVERVTENIAKSKAKIVAICNRSAKKGETNGFTIKKYYQEFKKYLRPAKLHYFIIDDGTVPVPNGFEPIKIVDFETSSTKIIRENLANPEYPQHTGGEEAAKVIHNLCASL